MITWMRSLRESAYYSCSCQPAKPRPTTCRVSSIGHCQARIDEAKPKTLAQLRLIHPVRKKTLDVSGLTGNTLVHGIQINERHLVLGNQKIAGLGITVRQPGSFQSAEQADDPGDLQVAQPVHSTPGLKDPPVPYLP